MNGKHVSFLPRNVDGLTSRARFQGRKTLRNPLVVRYGHEATKCASLGMVLFSLLEVRADCDDRVDTDSGLSVHSCNHGYVRI
jgi:hypothetical protein